MIDRSRSRLNFCLRPTTIGTAALVSISTFLALPLVALLCVIVGGFAYVGCVLAMLLLGLAGGLLLIVGGIALVAGLAGGRSEASGGGLFAGGIGLAGVALHDRWNKPVCAAGEVALAHSSQAAEFLTMQVFLGHPFTFGRGRLGDRDHLRPGDPRHDRYSQERNAHQGTSSSHPLHLPRLQRAGDFPVSLP